MSAQPRDVPIVLVVDDDAMTRLLVAEALEPEGFRMVEAASGEEGLDAFARTRADVVLLDLNMPGMGGFECCERIRRLPDGERVPILVITGQDDDDSIARAHAAGATDFASKPMRWKALAQRVRFLLRASRAFESVARSEARFRSLVDLSSDWYWEQDEAFRFTFFSEEGATKAGISVDGTLGKTRWEISGTRPLTGTWTEHLAVLTERKPFRDFEYLRVDDDGKPRYVNTSGEPVFDSSGRFRGYRGVGRNITGRKLAEQRLAVNAARQEWIAGFGQCALSTADVGQLLAHAAQAGAGTQAEGVVVLERSSERRFVVRAATGIGADIAIGTELALCDGSAAVAALGSEEPVVVADGRGDGCRCACPAWVHGAAVSVGVPIRGESGTLAVLVALASRAFAEDDTQYLRTAGDIVSSAVQRLQAEDRLAYLARYDSITALPNRNLLRDRLEQTIPLARREGRQVGVLFVDLDGFKLVNDTFGHQAGDRLLAEVGTRLRTLLRDSDTVARASGDEFVVVLPDAPNASSAAIVAQKILDAIALPYILGEEEASVSASIGIALYPSDGSDAESLLKAADSAMYRVKKSGRGTYCFFTKEMEQHSQARMHLQTDLRHGVEREQFRLVYQPKVDLGSQNVCGVEALLRWHHPERGTVSPAEFIPALEETGLILPVGEWVVREACRQIRAWGRAGLVAVPIAVNVSARQFQAKDLDKRIIELVNGEGVDPRLLELEITESHLVQDPEHAATMLRRLREAGIRISIDDFGTGYSSLAYLTRLPVSALKVDRSFVRDATTDASDAAIVRAVIDMAKNLGFVVIAEGVETPAQVAFLKAHGCDQAQGYFFGKPMPSDEITALLAQRTGCTSDADARPDPCGTAPPSRSPDAGHLRRCMPASP